MGTGVVAPKPAREARVESLETRRLLTAAVGGWTSLDQLPAAKGLTSELSLSAFSPYTLNRGSIAHSLSLAPLENVAKYGIGRGAESRLIYIPTPENGLARFRIVESSILGAADAKKFSSIKTYVGYGVDDSAASIRLDLTPLGFHAQVLSPNGRGAYYVEPYYHNDQGVYVSYYKSEGKPHGGGCQCAACMAASAAREAKLAPIGGDAGQAGVNAGRTSAGNSGTAVSLRTYRTAVAATGEYSAYFGGTVANAQAAIVTAINRVTGIYETELAIRLTLVSNNSNLVYTSASTDPYTNNNPSTLLTQNQANVDSIIGSANYDIGHVFSTGGGGLAGLGVVGNSSRKAQGETGSPTPTGDAFYVDYVAHEMGHQFGANHTFNTVQGGNSGNRSAANAYEPGSASTIMGYAGITGDDLQPNSDPYFAWRSIDEILSYVDSTIPTVGVRTATGNSVPTVSPGANYTIPANTPFALTASGSDPDGDTIYYSWEEADLGSSTTLNSADNGASPLFRVYNPTISPTRLFPKLSSILSGANATYASEAGGSSGLSERLPTTSRTMKFVITARDRRAGAGGTNVLSAMPAQITSVAAANTFAVSNFNSATTFAGGTTQTLTWNVAGTTGNGINTANVQISMSTDGGLTFPTVLNAATANDGSEGIFIPGTTTTQTQVRFKVAAVGNIYFDINNANITVTPATAVSATPGTVDLAGSTDSGVSNTDNLTNYNNATPAKAPVVVVSGTVAGATVTVYADGGTTPVGTATAAGTLATVTLNGSTVLADGSHLLTAKQTEPGKTLSAASDALPVTIDTAAPAVVSQTLEYLTVKPRVVVTFDSNLVVGNSIPTIVRNSPPPGGVAYNQFLSGTGNVANYGFDSSPNGILPDGNYTITLPADTYRDAAGNSTAATTLNFFYLAGDANHDGKVDVADLGILSTNWQTSGKNFAQGDFNYDGTVDVSDLGILSTNWQKTISTTAPAISPSKAVSVPSKGKSAVAATPAAADPPPLPPAAVAPFAVTTTTKDETPTIALSVV